MPIALAATLVAAGLGAQPAEPVGPVSAAVQPVEPQAALPLVPPPTPKAILPKGTMIRLMVLNEVNSRDHKAGYRFVLRVDEEVKVGTLTVIPVGAKAWGEVISAQGTGGAGKSGQLNAKLLYVEAGDQRIPLDGSRQSAGGSSTGQVVGAVVAFGIFGLLAKGKNAALKAGEIINGYTVDEARFDQQTVAAAK